MKQLFINGPRKSIIKDVPDISPNDDQILIKVRYNGVCMSDWHPWNDGLEGPMGHEPIGVVVAMGKNVTGFNEGDRVTGLATTASLAEYCLIHKSCAVHVPECLKDEDAVVEPLSCLVSVASKLRIEKAGDPVAVVGTGYMGLGILSLLKLQGAGNIIAVDIREQALLNAAQFGATECYHPNDVPKKYILDDDTKGNIWNYGLQVVSEFSGEEDGLRLAGDMTSPHGTLGVGGWHQGGDRTVDFRRWGWKAITVINTHERRQEFQVNCCRNALSMLASGQWNFVGVSNHIYGLNEFDRANEDMVTKPNNLIKALIDCSAF